MTRYPFIFNLSFILPIYLYGTFHLRHFQLRSTDNGQKTWAAAGIEPATSRTRNENHTTRPSSRDFEVDSYDNQILFKIERLKSLINCGSNLQIIDSKD